MQSEITEEEQIFSIEFAPTAATLLETPLCVPLQRASKQNNGHLLRFDVIWFLNCSSSYLLKVCSRECVVYDDNNNNGVKY